MSQQTQRTPNECETMSYSPIEISSLCYVSLDLVTSRLLINDFEYFFESWVIPGFLNQRRKQTIKGTVLFNFLHKMVSRLAISNKMKIILNIFYSRAHLWIELLVFHFLFTGLNSCSPFSHFTRNVHNTIQMRKRIFFVDVALLTISLHANQSKVWWTLFAWNISFPSWQIRQFYNGCIWICVYEYI